MNRGCINDLHGMISRDRNSQGDGDSAVTKIQTLELFNSLVFNSLF